MEEEEEEEEEGQARKKSDGSFVIELQESSPSSKSKNRISDQKSGGSDGTRSDKGRSSNLKDINRTSLSIDMPDKTNSQKIRLSDSSNAKEEMDNRLHEIYEDLKKRAPEDKVSSRLVKAYEDSVIRSQIIAPRFSLRNLELPTAGSQKALDERTRTNLTEKVTITIQQATDEKRKTSISEKVKKNPPK